MARLVVQHPGIVDVLVDGSSLGETNSVIELGPGRHTVTLAGVRTDPPEHIVDVAAGADPKDLIRIGFGSASEQIDRFSPLYCRYNGFLLGQFATLCFAEYGRAQYPVWRTRMLEFFEENEMDIAMPEEPVDLESGDHEALLLRILRSASEKSKELGDFTLLGSILTHHGLLAASNPTMVQQSVEAIEAIRERYDLPPIDPERFVVTGENLNVDNVLSPLLEYLASAMAALDVEKDTAFVIMPFKPPFGSYFPTLYRPSLEDSGYRAIRAWGGLSHEDYGATLLTLIRKAGLVWADVSEMNPNVLYEVGAAQALDKPAMLVVREDVAKSIPANIGHDTVVVYSPEDGEWPKLTILRMSMMISVLKAAAEAGRKIRVTPEMAGATMLRIGELLKDIIVPQEARDAARQGSEAWEREDHEAAERFFDDAIELGLDDWKTLAGRGTSRLSLGRYDDAENDLTRVLEMDSDTTPPPAHWSSTYYLRGLAREQQGKYLEARDDYGHAIELGYPDVEAYRRRAFVSIRLGDLELARGDSAEATRRAPGESQTFSLQGDLLLAEEKYADAVDAYDRALALEPNVDVEFSRALALLLDGRVEASLEGYRRGRASGAEDQIAAALEELRLLGSSRMGMKAAEEILARGTGS